MRTSSSKSFDVPFTSAAHGLFTIEIGSCLVRLDFSGTGGQTPRISVNTWPRVYLQLHEKIYTPLTGVPTCSRVYLPSTTRFLRIAHGCALQYCRRLGGDNWFSEMSGLGVDDWEEAPAELEPPQDGWPWQLALCRVFECQQTGYSRSFKIQCTKMWLGTSRVHSSGPCPDALRSCPYWREAWRGKVNIQVLC